MQRHFFPTLQALSTLIFATTTVMSFVLLRNSRFNFHCYTQREAMPTQQSARKWSCNLSRLLARKITKGIHVCKPVSLNRPIYSHVSNWLQWLSDRFLWTTFTTFQMSHQFEKCLAWSLCVCVCAGVVCKEYNMTISITYIYIYVCMCVCVCVVFYQF